MEQTSPPLSNTTEEFLNFLKEFQSISLSTIGQDGRPECSYAPFVTDENGCYYIFISGLASHTKNLFNDPRVGVMFIEPELHEGNIFARKRVTFNCEAELIVRGTNEWQARMMVFDEELGPFMGTLRSLPDFSMFQLIPKSGRFVKGFGKTYEITGETMDRLEHVNPAK